MAALGEKARGKVYVRDPAEVPPGVQLQHGPRGGLFYAGGAVVGVRPTKIQRVKPQHTPKGRAAPKPKAPKPEKLAPRKPGERFNDANDPRLPRRIQNEAPTVRKQWADTFNRTLGRGGSEADAISAANATLPKRTQPKPASSKPPKRQVGQAFAGATDPNLPRRIQAESPAVRAQWVSAFNANVARGSEADAVAAANRVLPDRRPPKEPKAQPAPRRGTKGANDVGEMTLDCDHLAGEKCAMCDGPAMAMPMYQPFGGATSFDDIDRWKASQKVREDVDVLADMFEAVSRNVWADENMTLAEKAAAIAQAAADLKSRLGDPVDDAEELDDEGDMAEMMGEGKEHSPLGRLRRLFVGDKAVTKREGGVDYRASDYADVADESKPSTWKLRLAEGRPGNVTVAQVARAITALQPGGFRGQRVELGSSKAAVVAKISGAIDRAKGDDAGKANLRKRLASVKEVEWNNSPSGSFAAFKDADGAWRWLAIFTNKFEDREGEVFSESAHREYESYVDRSGDFPELRLWHVPGSRIGVADEVAYDDRGFMLAAGRYDAGMEAAAEALKEAGPLGVSHGYLYRPGDLVNGVFSRYRSFEISPLPFTAAANQLTGYHAGAEDDMSIRPEKRAFLERILGADKAKALEETVGELADKASKEGLAFKDLAEILEPVAKPAAPAPAATPAPEDGQAAAADTKELVIAAVKEALGPTLEAVAGLKAKIDEQAAEIASLKETADKSATNLWRPRAQPGAKAASAAETNIVNGDAVTAAQASNRGGNHMDYYLSVMGIGGDPDKPEGLPTPTGAQA